MRLRGARTSVHTRDRSIRYKNKNTGVCVNLISYLPTMITTLFSLAAGLLLGFIQ